MPMVRFTGSSQTIPPRMGLARPPAAPLYGLRGLRLDTCGSVLVEAAFAMPVLIMLLLGIVTYGSWFMAAHSLQEVANDAARASMAGLNATERQTLVNSTVASSVLYQGTLDPTLVTVTTAQDNAYYRVTLTYNAAKSSMYQNALIPLPSGSIVRNAVVQLATP